MQFHSWFLARQLFARLGHVLKGWWLSLLIWCDLGAVGGTGMTLDLSANATLAVHVLVAVVESLHCLQRPLWHLSLIHI